MKHYFPKRASVFARRPKKEKNVDNKPEKADSVEADSVAADVNALAGLEKTDTVRTIGKLKLRGKNDDLPQSWWFASTAVPLLAATIGPLANVLSIAALVSNWRDDLQNNGQLPEGADELGVGIPDPRWELVLNAISLACGFTGNFFLLLNFTKRVRYIVALPMSILFWFFATGILTAIVVAMHVYTPPISPGQTYSQGYWHAVLACILYMIGAMILMINMLGYFLGHYPQHFDLDDSQRTLILQTMMFFFWLAGGAGVFTKICGFSYSDALYFCDVTVLTIGFGDFTPPNDGGRGFVFPYTVIGIIFLGLMINSIRKFATTMSRDKVIKVHAMHERARTIGRTVTNENELRDRLGLPPRRPSDARPSTDLRRPSVRNAKDRQRLNSLNQYGHFKVEGRTVTFHEYKAPSGGAGRGGAGRTSTVRKALSRDEKMRARTNSSTTSARRSDKRQKLLLLKEEKDRFDAMREIQQNTHKFKQYYALSMSVLAFAILWCAGALVFMLAEKREQGMSYFQGLYFCYVSLLTIGYGDFSPKSNVGKAFFVVWSLLAVPTMTILISDMGDTVVAAINRGTFTLADWTVMPREGAWHDFIETHPTVKAWLQKKTIEAAAKRRLRQGFGIANPDMDIEGDPSVDPVPFKEVKAPTLEELASKEDLSDHELARKLALAIKRTAQDLHADPPKRYKYEEWVEFTRLIRFSAKDKEEVEAEEEEEGLVEWDWIGEDSPMLSDMTESEWVLDRLCESLNRYTRRQARNANHNPHSPRVRKRSSPRRLSVEKEEDGEDGQLTASASGSSSNGKGGGTDASEHWHEHKDQHPRDNLGKLHGQTESEAVREWEARIAKMRQEAKKGKVGEAGAEEKGAEKEMKHNEKEEEGETGKEAE